RYDAHDYPRQLLLHDLHLIESRNSSQGVLNQRDASHAAAITAPEEIGRPADDAPQSGHRPAAGTRFGRNLGDVLHRVANERHRRIEEIGHDHTAGLARCGGLAAFVEDLDDELIDVDVKP